MNLHDFLSKMDFPMFMRQRTVLFSLIHGDNAKDVTPEQNAAIEGILSLSDYIVDTAEELGIELKRPKTEMIEIIVAKREKELKEGKDRSFDIEETWQILQHVENHILMVGDGSIELDQRIQSAFPFEWSAAQDFIAERDGYAEDGKDPEEVPMPDDMEDTAYNREYWQQATAHAKEQPIGSWANVEGLKSAYLSGDLAANNFVNATREIPGFKTISK